MLAKVQESCYFFLVVLDSIGIALARTRRRLRDLLDIFVAMAKLLVDTGMLKNKLYAILLVLCTLPIIFLDGDATATIFISAIVVPMFFSKKKLDLLERNWLCKSRKPVEKYSDCICPRPKEKP